LHFDGFVLIIKVLRILSCATGAFVSGCFYLFSPDVASATTTKVATPEIKT
jgi:hypothetical protein